MKPGQHAERWRHIAGGALGVLPLRVDDGPAAVSVQRGGDDVADAERLGLEDGARVRVRSRHGEAELLMHRAEGLRPGELFTPFHTAETLINAVIGPHQDPYTHTPGYKVTAVRVERATYPHA